ncbi:hypothetical protein COV61_00740 [Candidatus Micrarchaeota archaeon CG11_big_fil_rev_8_21_14_0_20_47_5]|nr:MAG: hypothetical protein AUJ17_04665 [Candidatus Micrarchaeota archaeon CG1_02_47_40]PIN84227.1 MAG: hypothetical protein COV61_00740 [Candidatus Micrarchaeota archaeon CG11_big_fil_rev_8_21_14_0_20_47_5]
MEKTKLGILLGVAAGIIDVVPMLAQNLSWDANISAFCLWMVSGFLIARTDAGVKGALKGAFISFLVLLPAAILIGWKEPFSLVPILAMTAVLGCALGFLVEKYGE